MRLVSTPKAWLGEVLIAASIIEGDRAAQSRGPPSGPAVVTAGAAELFGIELGVEKNHYKRSKEVTIYALDY